MEPIPQPLPFENQKGRVAKPCGIENVNRTEVSSQQSVKAKGKSKLENKKRGLFVGRHLFLWKSRSRAADAREGTQDAQKAVHYVSLSNSIRDRVCTNSDSARSLFVVPAGFPFFSYLYVLSLCILWHAFLFYGPAQVSSQNWKASRSAFSNFRNSLAHSPSACV